MNWQPKNAICTAGHHFSVLENGILQLATPAFLAEISSFEQKFERVRSTDSRAVLDKNILPKLPEILADKNWEWRFRKYSLQNLQKLIAEKTNLNVLEISPWNGWLSHQLAAAGHRVTAVGYFSNDLEGLGAAQFYPIRWKTIQIDIRDLSVFPEKFDLVILNHSLAFTPEPVKFAENLLKLVKSGGQIALLGLSFYSKPEKKVAILKKAARDFELKNGFPLFAAPVKGVLDFEDKKNLEKIGFEIQPYFQLRTKNWVARWFGEKPFFCCAIFGRAEFIPPLKQAE